MSRKPSYRMYLELSDIIVFAVLAMIFMIWWHGFTIRQLAISHAKRFCKERELQYLDEGIALSFNAFQRNRSGRLNILRHCQFEFSSTGEDRYQGNVVMLGRTLVEIKTPAYRMPEQNNWLN
ncbi:DUF3301 domain-containing protein [Sansalvadorimonas sp. 2012CJ34-2]|uniref:DUF3301 domain-containing protein n=1 Tax=Parendozoicomonas callyspongiae TaxID=2942213 RepID=A0ABT0PE18_9GAMM|nr:DUF3301 domain-containing protein [Sansalvadorimonas sp. 2012CJ34-2]MCL6269609.1 DUF3301 domain-containing protein [Sansalvadorimonas sp. 2012CJ34-2]